VNLEGKETHVDIMKPRVCGRFMMWARLGSNQRPTDYEATAVAPELGGWGREDPVPRPLLFRSEGRGAPSSSAGPA
jgi:hypothetical protein